MGRKPQDRHSQREVAVLLRTAIDAAERDGRAWRSVERIVRQNPHASISTHVTHNLGVGRARALRGRPFFVSRYGSLHDSLRASLPLRRDAWDSLTDEERAIVGEFDDYDWEHPVVPRKVAKP
jgi:hypothetical protein